MTNYSWPLHRPSMATKSTSTLRNLLLSLLCLKTISTAGMKNLRLSLVFLELRNLLLSLLCLEASTSTAGMKHRQFA